ncbi:DUF2326 domain-containing protein [Undibacterium sp.]|uniref:DUF2326 domain-containing protein n=1 Tax=Undibacterium sp. TaxID=1914977 RepID=UPI002D14171A|nr:DUF2326 domain-containing protein [Undibacterium sp.]HTD05557.1 DUF2326 domain-containing protein [Undibacterium sp.]
MSSFKTVEFNPDGLTLIVGVKTPAKENKAPKGDKTYNGVGKSLLIELIHFCLASKAKESFKKTLPGWEFTLTFEIDGIQHTASRNTLSQSKIFLDHNEITLPKYKSFLEERVFNIPTNAPGLAFRPLISKFIRSGSQSYNKPDETISDYTPYDALVRNCFLLGLDTDLIVEKSLLRKEYSETEQLVNSFEKDTVIRDFFKGDLDVDITLTYSQEEIRRLEDELKRFEVAANYYEIQQEADKLADRLFDLKNQIVLIRNAIGSIDASLKQKPDISREKVLALYSEVVQAFRPETIKHLDEVEHFHQSLLANRIARLSRDKLKFIKELSAVEDDISAGQVTLDQKLALLGSSRALDQFVAITNQISALKAESQKLRDFKELKQKYSDSLAKISSKLSAAIIKTNAYLSECEEDVELKLAPFRSLAKRFYPKAPAGISLKNNEGENQIRFDLDIRIQNDASDGINEVRLFCFDMTLLLAKSHKARFLVHDSRLFSDIDPRQRAVLFKTAHELTKSAGLQYIATMNEDQIESMSDQFTIEELDSVINKNITVRLKDDSAESKLLGIQVDLQY